MTDPLNIVSSVNTGNEDGIVPAFFANSEFRNTSIDMNNVNEQIPLYVTSNPDVSETPLATQLYTTAQFAPYPTITELATTASEYLNISGWGAPNGYASLDNTGKIPESAIPSGAVLNFPMQSAWVRLDNFGDATYGGCTVQNLFPASDPVLTPVNSTPVPLLNITITGPGWSWIPVPLGYIQGSSSGSFNPQPPSIGTGNAGVVTFQDSSTYSSSGAVHGVGVCADMYSAAMYPIVPGQQYPAAQGGTVVPSSPYPGNREIQFTLYGSTVSDGTTYTFIGANLTLVILIAPAMNVSLVGPTGQTGITATIENAVATPQGGTGGFGSSP